MKTNLVGLTDEVRKARGAAIGRPKTAYASMMSS